MSNCVNISHPDFVKLEQATGINSVELEELVSDWQEENNTDEFPTKEDLLGENNNIKSGVQELFESTPKLANAVYEALGFQTKTSENEITRGIKEVFPYKVIGDYSNIEEGLIGRKQYETKIGDDIYKFEISNYSYENEDGTYQSFYDIDFTVNGSEELVGTGFFDKSEKAKQIIQAIISQNFGNATIRFNVEESKKGKQRLALYKRLMNQLGYSPSDEMEYALFYNTNISSSDKIIFGHPTIGKSFLKKQGENKFITLDDDYANEVNAFVDANRGTETRQEYKGRKPKEYNEFMLNLYDRLKAQAKKEGKILFVSNTNILKERMSDFDKVITMPKEEFKKRFDARGATYGFEDWKSDIDATVAKVPSNKVISTTGYLSDLFESTRKINLTPQQKQQAQSKFQEYVNATGKQDIEGFKKFVGNNNILENPKFSLKEYKAYREYKEHITNLKSNIIDTTSINNIPDTLRFAIFDLIKNENLINTIKELDNPINVVRILEDSWGQYNWLTKKITIEEGAFNPEVLAHELLHGATHDKLVTNSDFNFAINDLREQLFEIYKKNKVEDGDEYTTSINKKFNYAFSSNDEFLSAAFSDEDFITFMKSIKVNEKLTFYEKFKQLVFNIFNITNTHDYLNKIIDIHYNEEKNNNENYNLKQDTKQNIFDNLKTEEKNGRKKIPVEDVEYFREMFGDLVSELGSIINPSIRNESEDVVTYPEKTPSSITHQFKAPKNEEGLTPDNEFKSKLESFMAAAGISQEVLSNMDKDGNTLNINGVAKLMQRIIAIVKGAGLDVFTEEVMHFYVEFMASTNHRLYNAMKERIKDYAIYQQVLKDYANKYTEPDQFIKEAIAKQLTKQILEKTQLNEGKKKEQAINVYFNANDKAVKDTFNSNPEELDVFSEAVNKFLGGDFSDLDLSLENELSGEYYNVDTAKGVNKARDALDNPTHGIEVTGKHQGKDEEGNDINVYDLKDKEGKTFEAKTSVTREIKKKFKNKYKNNIVSDTLKSIWNLAANYGTAVHNDIENIINRNLKAFPNSTVQKVVKTNSVVYKILQEALDIFIDNILKNHPNAEFVTEFSIYDPKTEAGGTIDFMILLPDGRAIIYDFKTLGFTRNKQGKVTVEGIRTDKEDEFKQQLKAYKQTLENYYGLKVISSSVLPIATRYTTDKQTGDKTLHVELDFNDETSKSYLTRVPVDSSEIEDNVELKSLVDKLNALKDNLQELVKSARNQEDRLPLMEAVSKLSIAIRDLLVKRNAKALIESGAVDIKNLLNRIDQLDTNEIRRAKGVAEFYRDIRTSYLFSVAKDLKNIDEKLVDNLIERSMALLYQLDNLAKEKIAEAAESVDIENVNEIQRRKSDWTGKVRHIQHPVFKVFTRLLDKVLISTHKKLGIFRVELKENITKLNNWAKANGISEQNAIRKLFDFDKNGKWTGRLLPKYNKDFYSKRDESADNGEYQWIIDNTNIKEGAKEKYEENLKRYKERNEKYIYHYDEKFNAIKRKEALDKFIENNDIWGHKDTAYLNKKNQYIEPKDTWFSKQYQELKKEKELFEVYTWYNKHTAELLRIADAGYKPNFVPNVHKELLKKLLDNGLNLKADWQAIKARYDMENQQGVARYNEFTGEQVYDVHNYYINDLKEIELKSEDIFNSLDIFFESTHKNKDLIDMEGVSLLLQDQLKNQKVLKEVGKEWKHVDDIEDFKAFESFVRSELYGNTTQGLGEDSPVATRVVKDLVGANVIAKLAFSTTSAIAAIIGGGSQFIMAAVSGRDFSLKQAAKAAKMVISGDLKTAALLEFFTIHIEDKQRKERRNLSVNKIIKNVDADNLLVLLSKPDYGLKSNVAMALMLNYTVKDGELVIKEKDDKSIYELAEIEGDKLTIKGLTDLDEDNEFRLTYKLKRITEAKMNSIIGNSTKYDRARYQNYILGNVMGSFRSWIPMLAAHRFKKLDYDHDFERYEQGFHRSFFSGQLWNERFVLNMLELMKVTSFGGTFSESFNKYIEQKYYWEQTGGNPAFAKGKLSLEEYKKIQEVNLKAAMTEIYMIILLTMALMAIGLIGDDEKKKKKWLYKITRRGFDEVAFFLNPTSFTNIVSDAAPVAGFLKDALSIPYHVVGGIKAEITGDEKDKKKYNPVDKLIKITPAAPIVKLGKDAGLIKP